MKKLALPRRLQVALVAATLAVPTTLAVTLATPAALAATFAEVPDAGDLPGTAQTPTGTDSLPSITGSLTTPSDEDVYAICLTGGGAFSADTSALPDVAGNVADTQLFLFDSNGLGIVANDDSTAFRSLIGTFSTPGAGLHYLAVSAFNNDPVSAGGEIFSPGSSSPAGPGGGQPVSGWTESGNDNQSGAYEIVLTGATFIGDGACPATGTLTVNKVFVNQDGTTPADFDIQVDLSPVPLGVPVNLAVGSHTVSESGSPVYTGDCDGSDVVEIFNGDGQTCTLTNDVDAGDLPGDAKEMTGFNQLTTISGNLVGNDSDDADVYGICLEGYGTFSATTDTLPNVAGNLGDTQLFLFDAAGNGVYANDDDPDATVFNVRSTLPAGHPLTPVTPGFYYLGVTGFDFDPVNMGGMDIFPAPAVDGETVGPIAPGPWVGWSGTAQTGAYRIDLTGARLVAGQLGCQTAELTVTKVVDNAAGGDLSVEDFPLTVTGLPDGATIPVQSGVPIELLASPFYLVTETQQPGYDGPVYSGDCNGGAVRLFDDQGEPTDRACTLTNTARPASLTVEKIVINDDDGTSLVGDFDLLLDGVSGVLVSGGEIPVVAGTTYTVSEGPHPGYTSEITGDCAADGTITPTTGQNAVCLIINDDIAPAGTNSLTVGVVGGDPTFSLTPAAVADFTLDPGEQVTFDDLAPGAYTLTMTDLEDGFVLDSVTCGEATTATSLALRQVSFTIGETTDVTCIWVVSEEDDGYDQYPGDSDFDFDTPFDNGDGGTPPVQVAGDNTTATPTGGGDSQNQTPADPTLAGIVPGAANGGAFDTAPAVLDTLPRTGAGAGDATAVAALFLLVGLLATRAGRRRSANQPG